MTQFLQGCTDLFSSFRQQDPFGLLHDPALQRFGSVAFFDIDGLLGDDFTAVRNLIDKVNSSAGDLYTVIQSCLMNPQTVEALSAEGRDQGGVDVDNPLWPLGGELFREDAHEACQNDQIGAVALQHSL